MFYKILTYILLFLTISSIITPLTSNNYLSNSIGVNSGNTYDREAGRNIVENTTYELSDTSGVNVSEGEVSDIAVLRVRVYGVDTPLEGVVINVYMYDSSSNNYILFDSKTTGYDGLAQFKLLPGTYRVIASNLLYGVISDGLVLREGETRDLVVNASKIRFVFRDAEGGLINGVYYSLYTTKTSSNLYERDEVLASLTADESYVYLVPGIYIVAPEIPGYSKDHLVFIDEGVERNYTITILRYRFTFYFNVVDQMFEGSISYSIYREDEPGTTYYSFSGRVYHTSTVYLDRGSYELVITRVDEVYIGEYRLSFTVSENSKELNVFFGKVEYVVENAPLNTTVYLGLKLYKISYLDEGSVAEYLGVVNTVNKYQVLPPGIYIFKTYTPFNETSYNVTVDASTSKTLLIDQSLALVNISLRGPNNKTLYPYIRLYVEEDHYNIRVYSDGYVDKLLIAVPPGSTITYTLSGYGYPITGTLTTPDPIVYTVIEYTSLLKTHIVDQNGRSLGDHRVELYTVRYVNGEPRIDSFVKETKTDLGGWAYFYATMGEYMVMLCYPNDTKIYWIVNITEQVVEVTLNTGQAEIYYQPVIVDKGYLGIYLETPRGVMGSDDLLFYLIDNSTGSPVIVKSFSIRPGNYSFIDIPVGVYGLITPWGSLVENIVVSKNTVTWRNFTLGLIILHFINKYGYSVPFVKTYVEPENPDLEGITPLNYMYSDENGLTYLFIKPGSYNVTVELNNGFRDTIGLKLDLPTIISHNVTIPSGLLVVNITYLNKYYVRDARVYVTSLTDHISRSFTTRRSSELKVPLPPGQYYVDVYLPTYYYRYREEVVFVDDEVKYLDYSFGLVNITVSTNGLIDGDTSSLKAYIESTNDPSYKFNTLIHTPYTLVPVLPGNYTVYVLSTYSYVYDYRTHKPSTIYNVSVSLENQVSINVSIGAIGFNITSPPSTRPLSSKISVYYAETGDTVYSTSFYGELFKTLYLLPGRYLIVYGSNVEEIVLSPGDSYAVAFRASVLNLTITAQNYRNTYLHNTYLYIYYLDGYSGLYSYLTSYRVEEIPYTVLFSTLLNTTYEFRVVASNYEETYYVNTTSSYQEQVIDLKGLIVNAVSVDGEPVEYVYFAVYNRSSWSGSYYDYLVYTYTLDKPLMIPLPSGEYTLVFPGTDYWYSSYSNMIGPGLLTNMTISSSVEYYELVLGKIVLNTRDPRGREVETPVQAWLNDKWVAGSYNTLYLQIGYSYRLVIPGLSYGDTGKSPYKGMGYGLDLGSVYLSDTRVCINLTLPAVNITLDVHNFTGFLSTYIGLWGYDPDPVYVDYYRVYGSSTYIVLTPGTYGFSIGYGFRSSEMIVSNATLHDGGEEHLVFNLTTLILRFNIPDYTYTDLPFYTYIYIYEYNSGVSTEYRVDEISTALILYKGLYRITIPGYNVSINGDLGPGFEAVVDSSSNRVLELEVPVSVISVKINSPLTDFQTYVYVESLDEPGWRGRDYWIVDEGDVYIIGGGGTYDLYLSTVSNYISALTVKLGEADHVYREINVSVINYVLHSPIEYSSASEALSSKYVLYVGETLFSYPRYQVDGYTKTYYFYVYPGTYVLRDSYSLFVNETVSIGDVVVREIEGTYGAINASVVDVNQELVYRYRLRIYYVGGDEEVEILDRYVYSSRDTNILVPPGEYRVEHGDRYGYGRSVTVNVSSGAVADATIALGRLIVNVIDPYTGPVSSFSVKVYRVDDSLVTYGYTGSDGSISFDLTSGEYHLYVYTLGYFYGVFIESGEVTNLTYYTEPSDLYVVNVTWEPSIPNDGDDVLIYVNISNAGPTSIVNEFSVKVYIDDELAATREFPGLIVNGYIVFIVTWRAEPGNHTIRVEADPEMIIYDSDRSNNVFSKNISVKPPDLEVVEAFFTTELVDGSVSLLSARIVNNGPGYVREHVRIKIVIDGEQYTQIYPYIELAPNSNTTLLIPVLVRGGAHTLTIKLDPYNDLLEANESNNVFNHSYYVAEPDLALVNVTIYPSELSDGDTLYVNYSIANIGSGGTLASFYVYLKIDDRVVALKSFHGLNASTMITDVFSLVIYGGDHNLSLIVDPHGFVGESNRSNNVFYELIHVKAPDLAITGLNAPSEISDHEVFQLEVAVTNHGDYVMDKRLFVKLLKDGRVYGVTVFLEPIGIGETKLLTINLDLPGGTYNLTVILDPMNSIAELNESNNMAWIIVNVSKVDLEALVVSVVGDPTVDSPVDIAVSFRNNLDKPSYGPIYVSVWANDTFIGQALVNGIGARETTVAVLDNVVIPIPGDVVLYAVVDDYYEHTLYDTKVYRHTFLIGDIDRSNNNVSAIIHVKAPDLVVTGYWYNYTYLYTMGELIIEVSNIGDANSKPFIAGIFSHEPFVIEGLQGDIFLEYTPYGQKQFPGIPAGGSMNITFKLFARSGGYPEFEVLLDLGDKNIEYNELNDFDIPVNLPSVDLMIANISFSSDIVNLGEYVNMTFTIVNNGAPFYYQDGFSIRIGYSPTREPRVPDLAWIRDDGDYRFINNKTYTVSIRLSDLGYSRVYVEVNPPSLYAPLFPVDDGVGFYYTYGYPLGDTHTIRENNYTNNVMGVARPLLRSLTIPYTGFLIIKCDHYSNTSFYIVNQGDVELSIDEISFDSPYVRIAEDLPVTLRPGEQRSLTVVVDTNKMKAGLNRVLMIVKMNNESYIVSRTVAVQVVDPSREDVIGGTGITRSIEEFFEEMEYSLSFNSYYNIHYSISNVYRGLLSGEIIYTGNATKLLSVENKSFTLNYNTFYIAESISGVIPWDPSIPMGRYVLNLTIYTCNRRVVLYTHVFTFNFYHYPVILKHTLWPVEDNAVVPSINTYIVFRVNTRANADLYYRRVGETAWSIIHARWNTEEYKIPFAGLEYNETYEYMIVVYNNYGNTSTGIRRLTPVNGVVWDQRITYFDVWKDYNQIIKLKIKNNDPWRAHHVAARVIDASEDLVAGFIGKGSLSNPLYLRPGSAYDNLTLNVHAYYVDEGEYNLTLELIDLDTNGRDYLVIHIYVHEYDTSFRVDYLGADNHTLIKVFRIVNTGDYPITGLTISLTANVSSWAFIQPNIYKYRLEPGESIVFYLVPILAAAPNLGALPTSTCGSCSCAEASSNGSTGGVDSNDPLSGRLVTIDRDGDGYPEVSVYVRSVRSGCPFNPPKLYYVAVGSMSFGGTLIATTCVNSPEFTGSFHMSPDPLVPPTRVAVNIYFSPAVNAEPHNGTIYFNGHVLFEWRNDVIEGVKSFEIPPEWLRLDPNGKPVEQIIRIKTEHRNRGMYQTLYKIEVISYFEPSIEVSPSSLGNNRYSLASNGGSSALKVVGYTGVYGCSFSDAYSAVVGSDSYLLRAGKVMKPVRYSRRELLSDPNVFLCPVIPGIFSVVPGWIWNNVVSGRDVLGNTSVMIGPDIWLNLTVKPKPLLTPDALTEAGSLYNYEYPLTLQYNLSIKDLVLTDETSAKLTESFEPATCQPITSSTLEHEVNWLITGSTGLVDHAEMISGDTYQKLLEILNTLTNNSLAEIYGDTYTYLLMSSMKGGVNITLHLKIRMGLTLQGDLLIAVERADLNITGKGQRILRDDGLVKEVLTSIVMYSTEYMGIDPVQRTFEHRLNISVDQYVDIWFKQELFNNNQPGSLFTSYTVEDGYVHVTTYASLRISYLYGLPSILRLKTMKSQGLSETFIVHDLSATLGIYTPETTAMENVVRRYGSNIVHLTGRYRLVEPPFTLERIDAEEPGERVVKYYSLMNIDGVRDYEYVYGDQASIISYLVDRENTTSIRYRVYRNNSWSYVYSADTELYIVEHKPFLIGDNIVYLLKTYNYTYNAVDLYLLIIRGSSTYGPYLIDENVTEYTLTYMDPSRALLIYSLGSGGASTLVYGYISLNGYVKAGTIPVSLPSGSTILDLSLASNGTDALLTLVYRDPGIKRTRLMLLYFNTTWSMVGYVGLMLGGREFYPYGSTTYYLGDDRYAVIVYEPGGVSYLLYYSISTGLDHYGLIPGGYVQLYRLDRGQFIALGTTLHYVREALHSTDIIYYVLNTSTLELGEPVALTLDPRLKYEPRLFITSKASILFIGYDEFPGKPVLYEIKSSNYTLSYKVGEIHRYERIHLEIEVNITDNTPITFRYGVLVDNIEVYNDTATLYKLGLSTINIYVLPLHVLKNTSIVEVKIYYVSKPSITSYSYRTVEKVEPLVEWIKLNTRGDYVVSDELNITLKLVGDEEKRVRAGWSQPPYGVSIYYFDEAVLDNVVNGTYMLTLDLSEAEEGPLGVSVEVRTSEELWENYAFELYIDRKPPIIQLYEPENYTMVSGVFNVTLLVFDQYYGLPEDAVWVNVSGASYRLYANDPYYIVEVNATNVSGFIYIDVYARDRAGHVSSIHLVYFVDSEPPVSTIYLPKYWWNTTVTLEINATDDVSGVYKTYYRVDSGDWVEGRIVTIPAPINHSNDGIHVIEYYSVDNAGNVEDVKNTSLGIDTVKPVLELYSPLNNTVVSGTVVVTGRAYDGLSGFKQLLYTVDNGSVTAVDQEYFNISIDTAELTDGLHMVLFTVFDNAGNSRVEKLLLRVDNTAPEAYIVEPLNHTRVYGVVTVRFNYSDENLYRAYLYIDDLELDVTSVYEYLWNTTSVVDGEHVLKLRAVDLVGHISEYVVVVYVDNTPPYASILYPRSEEVVYGNVTVRFNYTTDDLREAFLYIDGVAVNVTGSFEYVVDTTMYSDGYHNLTLVVYDLTGHVGVDTVVFGVDNNPPTALIKYPLNNTVFKPSGVINISLEYYDVFLDKSYIVINNEWYELHGEQYYLWNTTGLLTGYYNITLYVVDVAGRSASSTIIVYLDGETPNAVLVEPVNGSIVSGELYIRFNYSDNRGLSSIYLYLDNKLLGDVLGSYSYTLDTAMYSDGLHVVRLVAVDLAGNSLSVEVIVWFDNHPPVITIYSPRNNTVLTESFDLVYEVYDAVGVDRVELYVNGSFTAVLGLNETYTVDPSMYGEGVYEFLIKAFDLSNHSSVVELILVFDLLSPSLVVKEPLENTFYTGTLPVMLDLSDTVGLANATLLLNNSVVATIPLNNIREATLNTTLDVSKLGDDVYLLTVEIRDVGGHVVEENVLVMIDNEPPEINAPEEIRSEPGLINISYSVYDRFLDEVWVILPNGSRVRVEAVGVIVLNASLYEPGTYIIGLEAFDRSGKSSSHNITVAVEAAITTPTTTLSTTPTLIQTPTSTPTKTQAVSPVNTTTPTTTQPRGIDVATLSIIAIAVVIVAVAIFVFTRK